MCDLIRRGRLLLNHPDMPVAARLTAIGALFDEHAPAPRFPAPGEGRPGGMTTGRSDTPARPAGSLFTDWVTALTGEDVTAQVTSSTVPAGHYPELQPQLSGEHTATRREGLLVTGTGRPVARVSSVYLPGRMPPAAAGLLKAGIPLGRALAPAVRREPLPPAGGNSRGLLWIPGPAGEWPVAVATELLLA
jgi:hypothetical protein